MKAASSSTVCAEKKKNNKKKVKKTKVLFLRFSFFTLFSGIPLCGCSIVFS